MYYQVKIEYTTGYQYWTTKSIIMQVSLHEKEIEKLTVDIQCPDIAYGVMKCWNIHW